MGPHAGQPVLQAGTPLGEARVVVIMVHGRNAGPATKSMGPCSSLKLN